MNHHRARYRLLLLACLMLVACQDRREPVKPTVAPAAAAIAIPA
jgi:outer membrane biogenesis lipoprotein LolB